MDEVLVGTLRRVDAARRDAADPVRAGRRAVRARRRHRPRASKARCCRPRSPPRRSARPSGSLPLALAAALAVGIALSMLHGYACVSHRGDQVVLGMAITMTAAGLTVVLGIAWFAQGGQTPPVPDAVRLDPLVRRRRRLRSRAAADRAGAAARPARPQRAGLRRAGAGRRGRGGCCTAPASACACAPPARTRRWSTPPASRCKALRYQALALNGVLCGAGRRLPGAGAEPELHPEHDRRPRLHGAGRDDLRQVAPGRRAVAPACCSAFSTRWRSACRAPCCRSSARCRCRRSRRCPTCMTVVLLAGFIGHALAPSGAGRAVREGALDAACTVTCMR